MELSVLIPTRQEAGRLPLLLADLQRWTGDIEILIADAGSTDTTTTAQVPLAFAPLLGMATLGRAEAGQFNVNSESPRPLAFVPALNRSAPLLLLPLRDVNCGSQLLRCWCAPLLRRLQRRPA